MDTVETRQRCLGYGVMLANWPTPGAHATITVSDRLYQWANYYTTMGIINPYYRDDYVTTTNALLVEQFRWRG